MKKSELLGHIDSIETMGLVDGPGIRVVVFLQGCSLRCIFCHNPETWNINDKLLMKPEELVRRICKYKNYFGKNGGVTFSGGEPLIQHEFLLETLKLCKKMNINTCLDTAGVGSNYEEILKYVDLVIYDIKAVDSDKYFEITGGNIGLAKNFLKYCQKINMKMWIRQVIIPGVNDNIEYILMLKKYVSTLKNVEKIELLPYHTYGVSKYKKLGLDYKLDGVLEMSEKKIKDLYQILIN